MKVIFLYNYSKKKPKVLIAYRIYLFLQFVTIALLEQGIVQWSWGEVFWPYWLFFAILAGLDFALFLLLLSKTCMAFSHEVPAYELKGVIVWFVSFVGHTTAATIIVLAFTDYENSGISNRYNSAFLTAIVVNSVLVFFMLTMRRSLMY